MRELIETLAAYPQAVFTEAAPFPHLVLDGLVAAPVVARLHEAVMSWTDWDERDDPQEKKRRSRWTSDADIPLAAADAVRALNSGAMLRALAQATGVQHLIADPYYSGGGFNRIERGGKLDVHIDGNWHDDMQVHRRLNLILYLNPNWRPEWGGALGLYDPDGRRPVSIEPRPGRVLVFETNEATPHGHPEPLDCPDDEARTSLILYYYTAKPRSAAASPSRSRWSSLGWREKV